MVVEPDCSTPAQATARAGGAAAYMRVMWGCGRGVAAGKAGECVDIGFGMMGLVVNSAGFEFNE